MITLKELPDRWQKNVENYLKEAGSPYKQFGASDFATHLRLVFEDGSTAFFEYSLYLADIESKEVAVFTEHCGYHVFPFCLKIIEAISLDGSVKSSNSFVIE